MNYFLEFFNGFYRAAFAVRCFDCLVRVVLISGVGVSEQAQHLEQFFAISIGNKEGPYLIFLHSVEFSCNSNIFFQTELNSPIN